VASDRRVSWTRSANAIGQGEEPGTEALDEARIASSRSGCPVMTRRETVGSARSRSGEAVRFFEMNLKRVGDTDWPAAGAIPPK
jgi:hypothetical protein